MVEYLDDDTIPNHKWGQLFLYNKPNIDNLHIWAYLNDNTLSLIANEAVDLAGELLDGDKFEYDKFEHYYMAWKKE